MKKAAVAKPTATPVPPVKKAAPRKAPSKGVRETLLKLLAESPQTRPQLLKKSGCSPASLHNHIKDLRANGIVVADSSNRLLSLKSQAAAPVHIGEIVEAAATGGSLVSAVDAKLFQALDALSFRLSPIARAREKLLVLDHLARSTPEPVAEILRLVFDDLSRLSGEKAHT